jgi:prepilin-type N-terminal cleavage/methylation domain-containing protein
MKRGHTLLELTIVLSLLGLIAAVAVGSARRQADELAARAAREELAGLIQRARVEARLPGEARVALRNGGPAALRVPPDSVIAVVDPGEEGVRFRIHGSRDAAELRFGPLGIGRAASLTVSLERGSASSTLVVSSHGRIRR